EVAALAPDARGSFALGAAPGTRLAVTRAAAPPEAWDQATARVRFRLDGDVARPGPGGAGWLSLPAETRPLLAIPDAAVLVSPEGASVLVASPDGRSFSKRRVELGRAFYGLSVVVSGLGAGERIAVESAFLLEAERRLRGGAPEAGGGPP